MSVNLPKSSCPATSIDLYSMHSSPIIRPSSKSPGVKVAPVSIGAPAIAETANYLEGLSVSAKEDNPVMPPSSSYFSAAAAFSGPPASTAGLIPVLADSTSYNNFQTHPPTPDSVSSGPSSPQISRNTTKPELSPLNSRNDTPSNSTPSIPMSIASATAVPCSIVSGHTLKTPTSSATSIGAPLDSTPLKQQSPLPYIAKKKHRPPELDFSQKLTKDGLLRAPASARNASPNVMSGHFHGPNTLEHKRSADSLLRKFRSPSLPSNVVQVGGPLVELPSFIKPISAAEVHDLLSGYMSNKQDSSSLSDNHEKLTRNSFESGLSTPAGASNRSSASSVSSSSTFSSGNFAEDGLSVKPDDPISPRKTPERIHALPEDDAISFLYDKSILDDVFIVDTRPFAYFTSSRIPNATHVCIPSTLLKRPAFTVARFAECMAPEQRPKLAKLANYKHIIVYDQSTYDAMGTSSMTLMYTLLKLGRAEEIKGRICYLQGGMSEFERKFPSFIDRSAPVAYDSCSGESPAKAANLNLGNAMNMSPFGNVPSTSSSMSSMAVSASNASPQSRLQKTVTPRIALPPVLTGFSLPAECKEMTTANTGFMSLDSYYYTDDAVPVGLPTSLSTKKIEERFPEWIKPITESSGSKLVARRFYEIEQSERTRLQSAFSRDRAFSTPSLHDSDGNVQYSVTAGVKYGYKNRYHNIWPYDHARVILPIPDSSCDYINASYISTDWSTKRYIATQAPLPETIADFWSVVWDENIPIIVMLTAEYEGGQLKCHQYWKDAILGNRFQLTKTDEKSVPLSSNRGSYVTVRRFRLVNISTSVGHDVVQIHYTEWPDLGAPASAEDLLSLCSLKNSLMKDWKYHHPELTSKKEPSVIVHCSAGCGRTGTFCTVDSVIDILSTQKSNPQSSLPRGNDVEEDLIYKVVNDFRCQRKSMVQSLRQYAICYESAILWCSREL
ncbi:tyrosine protein phosphatase PTP2 [Sugiyamaella lignohabitans]|uniref:protein-tyrosine-phosphatase n=1 Tax=Sugiyamaella lignohabitans TaxID=796027 RepID=A0A161HK79_9ASCO|nr:tyrosine protein phosphatase PTP2 [Sugiyamaella lignohabitans]ANB13327.1 tyrosine protein phosphatase PTP2 [Sugiyamaella lignohabitans]